MILTVTVIIAYEKMVFSEKCYREKIEQWEKQDKTTLFVIYLENS